MLKRSRAGQPTHPIFDPIFGFALVDDLLDQDKVPDALSIRDFYREVGPDAIKFYLSSGDLLARYGLKGQRDPRVQEGRALDPDNAEVARRLKDLADRGPGR